MKNTIEDCQKGVQDLQISLYGLGVSDEKLNKIIHEGRALIRDNAGVHLGLTPKEMQMIVHWPVKVLIWLNDDEIVAPKPTTTEAPTKTDPLKDLMSSVMMGPLYFVDKLIYYVMGPTFSSLFRSAFPPPSSPTPVANCTLTSTTGVAYTFPCDPAAAKSWTLVSTTGVTYTGSLRR